MTRRRSRAAGVVALFSAAVLATVVPARAQDSSPTTEGSARLSLVGQDAWVGPDGGTFDFRVRVDDAPPGAQLAVEVYPSVRSRTAFERSIEGEDLGSPLRPLPPVLPLDLLERGDDGSVALAFPVSTTTPPPLGIRVTGQGVFPVRVSLLDADDDELDQFVTHLVRLPTVDTAARPLGFSLVVPFAAAPGFGPDGQARLDDADVRRLGAAVRALSSNTGVPLVVDPVPETVDATYNSGEAGSTGVTTLARSLASRQVLGDSYVRLDLGAWVESPDPLAADELTRQATTGNEVLAALLGLRPDRRTTVVDRSVTPEALTRLNEIGVDQLVVPEDQLGPLSGQAAQVTFTQRFDVANSEGRAMPAVAADAGLAERLAATDDPVLNAHLALADLAVLFFDRPNVARGAVLVVPPDLDVPEQTYDALLSGLARPSIDLGLAEGGHQIVAPMTLDDLFDTTEPATTSGRSVLVRPYLSDVPAPLGTLLARVGATRDHIASFANVVGAGAGAARIPVLDRQVLVAEAAGVDDDRRDEYLDGVSASIDGQLAAIVTPQDQRVTLTDRSGDIPITIDNQLDYPVDVLVTVTSAKLEFPEGNVRTVTLPPATPTQIDFGVEAKASGAFPVDVSVQSPDGSLVVGSARYTVRSTAISGVGLVLSVGAGAFLLLWWARHWRSIRRDRRLVSTSHPSMRPAPSTDEGSPAPTGR